MRTFAKTILVLSLLILVFSFMDFNQLFVSGSPSTEDFTDGWTEEGTDTDKISQTATTSSWTNLKRADDACLYKSFGSGRFTDFVHTFDLNLTYLYCTSGTNRPILRCYELRTDHGVDYPCADGILLILIEIGDSSDWYHIALGQRDASAWVVSPLPRLTDSGGDYNFSVDTEYYILLNRTGTSLICEAYSDAERSTEVANATMTCVTDAYEYIQCPASRVWGTDPNDESSGYVENLDIQRLTLTFYFTSGGEFRVDNQTVTNGSSIIYFLDSVIEFAALPLNESYVFKSFNWTGGSATSNPYNYTVTSDVDIWLYFDLAAAPTPYIVARFTFNVSNPEPNDGILFNGSYSESSSTITAYNWTFGDGGTGSGETVTHSYSTENTFTVNLTVTSVAGTDSFLQNITVETKIVAWIRARFRFDPSNPAPDDNIQFNGSYSDSSSTITVYSWSFGDGNTSNIAEPIHNYNDNGTYVVNLTVTSSVGSNSFLQNVTVSLGGNGETITYTSAILIVGGFIIIPLVAIIILRYR